AALAAAAWAVGTDSALALGLLLLLAGGFGSAAHSAGGRAISAAFPQRLHGTALSIRHTAIPIGGVLGGVLVPWSVVGWGADAALAGTAIAGAAVAVGLWVALRGAQRAVPRSVERRSALRARSPLRSPPLWLLASGCASVAFVQLGIASFLTLQLVDEAGLSLGAAAAIFAGAQLAGAGARVMLGIWSDRVAERIALLRTVFIGVLVLVLASVAVTQPRVDGMLLALILVVTTSWQGVAVAAAASMSPDGRTGSTLGMQTTLNAVACTIAPAAIGVLLHVWGWTSVEVLLAVMCAIAVLGLTFAGRARQAVGAR
ncbi:MAG: Permease, MFS-type, partial [Thermoleophilia bacterium]|nr:Permease, MFS-type [Thermoleophilia bacterium]